MKKIKNYFNRTFLLLTLFGLATSNAQTVTVPANCRVVNVGTGVGGVLGLGGKVTNGGIVAMPDPGSGTFTFTPPVVSPVVTTATWNLKGDLSNNASIPNYGNPTQPAAGLSATIISYNKTFRNSEGVSPSSSSWARSKGQVKISWTGAGCGSSITFDIYKSFTASPVTNVPIIVGESCLKPNTQYTYSVDQIVSDNVNDAIGFDSYYWSGLPAAYVSASSTYTSADRSSITFTTGATVTGFTLQCCYGRVNPNTADGGISTLTTSFVPGSHSTCITRTLLVAPPPPTFSATTLSTLTTLNSTSSACLAIGQPTFTITYPTPPVTVPATIYTWSAQNTGWTYNNTISGGNTTTTVNTNSNNNPGTLTLTITGPCDPVIKNYQINRSVVAPVTIVPTSPSTTCITTTSSNVYTINANAVGVALTWSTIPASISGITLTPSDNTNSVTVTATGATPGSFTLEARGASPCNSTAISTPINVKPATPIFTTTSPTCVVKGTTSVTNIAIDTSGGLPTTGYVWNLSSAPGWTFTPSTPTNTSTPSFIPNGTTNGPVTIKAILNGTNGCNSAEASFQVTYPVVNTFPSAGGFDQYILTCGSTPTWSINGLPATSSSNIIIAGNVLLIGGSGTPPTSVCADTTVNGTLHTICATSYGTHGGLKQSESNSLNTVENIRISPNPNNGNFIIHVELIKENATARLIDSTGKEISSYKLHQGENNISNTSIAKGNYFVILNVDGKQEAKQIVVK